MSLIAAKAGLALAAVGAGRAPWWTYEEAPPDTTGLWIGLVLLAFLLAGVALAIRYHRRRRLRAISVLPEDPFAVDAMRACVRLFCELEPGWSGGELVADGPLRFTYVGSGDSGEQADGCAVVRVEGRLRPPSRRLTLSRGQRNGLLGLAAAILLAAFVGIALAPATKIRSAPPTTIVVRDGVPLGGTHLLTYRQGALIDLTIRSDVADEVHFHGYDIHKDVGPGRPVRFVIRATIEGSYTVELERHNETLAQVTVQP